MAGPQFFLGVSPRKKSYRNYREREKASPKVDPHSEHSTINSTSICFKAQPTEEPVDGSVLKAL